MAKSENYKEGEAAARRLIAERGLEYAQVYLAGKSEYLETLHEGSTYDYWDGFTEVVIELTEPETEQK